MTSLYRRLPSALWSRPAFKDLGHTTQLVYLLVWTHPDTTTAGTLDYHPARLAAFTGDLTADDIDQAIDTLEDAGMVVVDRDTDELAILTWWEDTTTLRQPYVVKNAIGRLQATASTRINRAIAERLHALNVAPVPSGLQTDIAKQYLADYPSEQPVPTSPVLRRVEVLPERVWAGHPLVVERVEDARCEVHAGGPVVVGCGACAAAVRVARDRV